jgi:GDPmannose 4,6-dehydratase
MQKRALITGVTGQDGTHMAQLLNKKGYKVYGIIRGQQNPKRKIVEETMPYVILLEADLLDQASLVRAVVEARPDEIYNLAAISFVAYSFKDPILTADVTGKGVLNLLEAVRLAGFEKKSRIYQASTSEMYGGMAYNRPEAGYDEKAIFHPRSPYGVAKLFGHWISVNYRESYDMHISCGILFNHEGPNRGLEFVTRKISNSVARISLGKQKEIVLGSLDPKRDWGYAGDYVNGMWLMLQQPKPDDYVLATGETHSIKEFLDLAFKEVGISDWKPYVKQDPKFMRPAEVDVLIGNPSKAEKVLGWKREVDFPGLVSMMVQHDLAIEA